MASSKIRFKVVLHKAQEGGYWVEVPALRGCFSQGENRAEALRNIQEAIALHLEAMVDIVVPARMLKNAQVATVAVGV